MVIASNAVLGAIGPGVFAEERSIPTNSIAAEVVSKLVYAIDSARVRTSVCPIFAPGGVRSLRATTGGDGGL